MQYYRNHLQLLWDVEISPDFGRRLLVVRWRFPCDAVYAVSRQFSSRRQTRSIPCLFLIEIKIKTDQLDGIERKKTFIFLKIIHVFFLCLPLTRIFYILCLIRQFYLTWSIFYFLWQQINANAWMNSLWKCMELVVELWKGFAELVLDTEIISFCIFLKCTFPKWNKCIKCGQRNADLKYAIRFHKFDKFNGFDGFHFNCRNSSNDEFMEYSKCWTN